MAYRKIYFRIRSKYEHDRGFRDPRDEAAFRKELSELFGSAGWQYRRSKSSSISDTVVKGEQDLYLHPMNFSGVIREEEAPAIRALLEKARTFQCYGVDYYEPYLEMSDEEYLAHLESERKEIITSILERYKTKRCDLFHACGFTMGIAEQFTVHRVCDKEGRRNKAYQYVGQLTQELIDSGRLITANTRNGLGICTATMKEVSR